MGEMRQMDQTGDTKVEWDPENEAEVSAARASFDTLKSKGYLAYQTTPSGGKGQVVREFDPQAEKIILAPPMAGGC